MSDWQPVIEFWRNAGMKKWFTRDDAFDAELAAKFLDLNEAAARGEHDGWANDAHACLALVLVLDQFSRNLFRGSAKAFSRDAKALQLARHAQARGFPAAIDGDLRFFYHMPFMHSESIADQLESLRLQYSEVGCEGISHAREHYDIIARFGRFPHRNGVLGRHTTPAEQAYLDGGGFKG
ncbi:MAG: DUF924 domain-containing protein [Nitratireductor sp.]|nr:DUF924 domain-containing protein [Nitratireductor sp.]